MELALTHWREKMGSNWQPGLGWIKGGEGTPTGTHFVLKTDDYKTNLIFFIILGIKKGKLLLSS